MTRHPAASFADRLALARRLVARGVSKLPIDVVDQLQATGRETRVLHDRLGAVLPILEPDRHWRQRADTAPSDTVRAYLLAALLGCTRLCIHLRRGGPRPSIARLPLGRVDCDRCSATSCRPITTADQFDVWTTTDVGVFWPFVVQHGPVMLAGDACETCAEVMGIRVEEVAS